VKELLRELTESCGTEPLEPPEELELGVLLLLLLHAAISRAALAATAVSPTLFVTEYNDSTSLVDDDVPVFPSKSARRSLRMSVH
jgi:hypothetical protein